MNLDTVYNCIGKYEMNVTRGYRYWCRRLMGMVIPMIKWTGLIDNLNSEEINMQLLINRQCGVYKDKNYGFVSVPGNAYGVGLYYQPTDYIYASPVTTKQGTLPNNKKLQINGKINADVAIIWASRIDRVSYAGFGAGYGGSILMEQCRRYAKMIAGVETSIDKASINARQNTLNAANNDLVKASIDEVYAQLSEGEYATITDKGIIDNFHTFPMMYAHGALTELIATRDSLIQQFIRSIGIAQAYDKKERMITGEVDTQKTASSCMIADIVEEQKRGAEMVNNVFGLSISCELNPEIYVDLNEPEESLTKREDEKKDGNNDESVRISTDK